MKSRSNLGGCIVVGVLILRWCCAAADSGASTASDAVKESQTASSRLRAFSLTDSRGEAVTDRSFRGEWLIVFFGFTNCPDTCPAALFKLSKALDALGSDSLHVRVAFVSIDPERDTPQALKAYLQPFGPRFTGLTGSQDQITATEQTFRAYAQKQPRAKNGSYGVDHSSAFYVVDPQGQFQRQVSAESSIPDLTASLRSALRAGSG
jgi:protein SCO1/2